MTDRLYWQGEPIEGVDAETLAEARSHSLNEVREWLRSPPISQRTDEASRAAVRQYVLVIAEMRRRGLQVDPAEAFQ